MGQLGRPKLMTNKMEIIANSNKKLVEQFMGKYFAVTPKRFVCRLCGNSYLQDKQKFRLAMHIIGHYEND